MRACVRACVRGFSFAASDNTCTINYYGVKMKKKKYANKYALQEITLLALHLWWKGSADSRVESLSDAVDACRSCAIPAIDTGSEEDCVNASHRISTELRPSVSHMRECLLGEGTARFIPTTIGLGRDIVRVPPQGPAALRVVCLADEQRYCGRIEQGWTGFRKHERAHEGREIFGSGKETCMASNASHIVHYRPPPAPAGLHRSFHPLEQSSGRTMGAAPLLGESPKISSAANRERAAGQTLRRRTVALATAGRR